VAAADPRACAPTAETAWLPPPPPPTKRRRSGPTVLSDVDYSAALAALIRRDFFPVALPGGWAAPGVRPWGDRCARAAGGAPPAPWPPLGGGGCPSPEAVRLPVAAALAACTCLSAFHRWYVSEGALAGTAAAAAAVAGRSWAGAGGGGSCHDMGNGGGRLSVGDGPGLGTAAPPRPNVTATRFVGVPGGPLPVGWSGAMTPGGGYPAASGRLTSPPTPPYGCGTPLVGGFGTPLAASVMDGAGSVVGDVDCDADVVLVSDGLAGGRGGRPPAATAHGCSGGHGGGGGGGAGWRLPPAGRDAVLWTPPPVPHGRRASMSAVTSRRPPRPDGADPQLRRSYGAGRLGVDDVDGIGGIIACGRRLM